LNHKDTKNTKVHSVRLCVFRGMSITDSDAMSITGSDAMSITDSDVMPITSWARRNG